MNSLEPLMRLLYPITLVITLLGAMGCANAPEPAPEEAQAVASGVIALAPGVRATIQLETAMVTRQKLPLTLEALGDVTARSEAQAVVHAPFEGVLSDVRARVGDSIVAGQTLATIRSAELGRAQATYLKALGESRLTARERQRQQRLFNDNLASKRELDESIQRDEAALVALRQAREELRIFGTTEAAIAALGQRGRVEPLHRLKSPVSGTITQRHALRGDRVAPGDTEPLFALADLSVVRIDTDIPERNWHAVKVGQTTLVSVDALPDKPVSGKVVRITPTLDAITHTGKAAIDVPNTAGHLRPGMSARVQLVLGLQDVPAVPVAAVQHEGERAFVFTALPDDTFQEKTVVVGARTGNWLPVKEGLNPGERVVTRGAFDLLSEARKASFGGD